MKNPKGVCNFRNGNSWKLENWLTLANLLQLRRLMDFFRKCHAERLCHLIISKLYESKQLIRLTNLAFSERVSKTSYVSDENIANNCSKFYDVWFLKKKGLNYKYYIPTTCNEVFQQKVWTIPNTHHLLLWKCELFSLLAILTLGPLDKSFALQSFTHFS